MDIVSSIFEMLLASSAMLELLVWLGRGMQRTPLSNESKSYPRPADEYVIERRSISQDVANADDAKL